ncbi:hypothetical protein IV102_28180 [bacterium]|nr:hypothetical protein [bacterium]
MKTSWVRWRIVALLVVAAFVAYLLRTNMSVAGAWWWYGRDRPDHQPPPPPDQPSVSWFQEVWEPCSSRLSPKATVGW